MISSAQKKDVKRKYLGLRDILDEHGLRRWAALEAESLGYGGITAVAEATGLGMSTVWSGVHEDEAEAGALGRAGRIRRL